MSGEAGDKPREIGLILEEHIIFGKVYRGWFQNTKLYDIFDDNEFPSESYPALALKRRVARDLSNQYGLLSGGHLKVEELLELTTEMLDHVAHESESDQLTGAAAKAAMEGDVETVRTLLELYQRRREPDLETAYPVYQDAIEGVALLVKAAKMGEKIPQYRDIDIPKSAEGLDYYTSGLLRVCSAIADKKSIARGPRTPVPPRVRA